MGDQKFDLVIDTGSSLELLLKYTDERKINSFNIQNLGFGLNGSINGVKMNTEEVTINNLVLQNVDTGIMLSEWHTYGSLGMSLWKDYIVVFNYYKNRMQLKRIGSIG
ncbi:MAG: hypothetical protein L0Y35_04140 [Flammeovirgaceae bacterium]|nr:hypothetical protein [Flammeovirgaceae bacterium]